MMLQILPSCGISVQSKGVINSPLYVEEIDALHEQILMSQIIPLISLISLIFNFTIMNASVISCHGPAAHITGLLLTSMFAFMEKLRKGELRRG